jgi:type II secretory pathway component PulF
MLRFIYEAYDVSGAKLQGEIKSIDESAAAKQLIDQNLIVISLVKESESNEMGSFFSRTRVSAEQIEYLTTELSLLLNAGVTIDKGLGILRRNSVSPGQSRLIGHLHDAVRRGQTLSDAMAEREDVFSPLYLNLVKLGETSGKLPDIFSRLSADLKFQSELKGKVVQALIYPGVIFTVCILCIFFVFNYIVPQMSSLFEGVPEIPFYTAMLLSLSAWMIDYQWYLLLCLILLFGALYSAARSPSMSAQLDTILAGLPGVSGMILLVERVRFNTALAMMLASGILIDRSLDMALGSVKNSQIKQTLVAARDRVKKGGQLSMALRNSPIYDDFSMSLVEVGEESGDLSSVFQEISIRARRDFEVKVDRMTALLEPALILVMGGIVGGVVVVMLLSIVSVNDVGL